MAKLLDLPDEVLVEVGLLTDVSGLLGVSLTCRRLRSIGQEALLRTAVLQPPNIWKLVNTLRACPDLAKTFTYLRFGSLTKDVYDRVKAELAKQRLNASNDTWNVYRDLLLQAYPEANNVDILGEMKSPSGFIFVALALVVALSPLKALCMTTNAIDGIKFMGNMLRNDGTIPRLSSPAWHSEVRALLRSRLEILDIVLDSHILEVVTLEDLYSNRNEWYSPTYISLAGFDRLKRLVVPYASTALEPRMARHTDIIFPYREPVIGASDATKVLPESLKSVCFCIFEDSSAFDVVWMDELFEALPNLTEVELRFQSNLYSTAWSICAQPAVAQGMLAKLQKWESSQLPITTTFGNMKLSDRVRKVKRDPPSVVPGNLAAAIERCLATTLEKLDQEQDLMEALGYKITPGPIA